jgi:hypothetical protein
MKRFLSSVAPAVVAFGLLAYASSASAQATIANQTITVNARVNAACAVQSGGGAVSLSSTLNTADGSLPAASGAGVTVRCTRGTSVAVQATTADAGSYGRSAACTDALVCGTDFIGYSLYVSSTLNGTPQTAATLLDGSATPVALGSFANRADNLAIAYEARFNPAADVRAGDYQGSVVVTYTVSP